MALNQDDEDDPIARLNEIASRRSSNEFTPSDVAEDELRDAAQQVQSKFDDSFERYEDGTPLSYREAQCFILSDTRLTENAIGVFIGYLEGKESPVSQPSVNNSISRADEKYDESRELLWTVTTTPAEDELSHPQVTWLESETLAEIRNRASDEDRTIDDVVSRLLEETVSCIRLRDFLETYVEAESKDVADVQLSKDLLGNGQMNIVVTLPHNQHGEGHSPAFVSEYDRILFDGDEYKFRVEESAMGPGGVGNAVQLYASDNIQGMDPVSVDEGLENLRDHLG